MKTMTENILKDAEEKIRQIEALSDWLERNSWEFESHTAEESFWLQLADKMYFIAEKIGQQMPF